MWATVKIDIEIEYEGVEHLKSISEFNQNYYMIKNNSLWGRCNVVFQQFIESQDIFSYSIGYLENNEVYLGKPVFQPMFGWSDREDIFENIKTYEIIKFVKEGGLE